MPYQAMIKTGESRNSPQQGPFSFPSAEARKAFIKGPAVYWYFLPEEDDWEWRRGGAWQATRDAWPDDRVPERPEITEDDRL